jgi:hypothetical protein
MPFLIFTKMQNSGDIAFVSLYKSFDNRQHYFVNAFRNISVYFREVDFREKREHFRFNLRSRTYAEERSDDHGVGLPGLQEVLPRELPGPD